jgi:flagellar biosynthesis anti-sigma factor FlgM
MSIKKKINHSLWRFWKLKGVNHLNARKFNPGLRKSVKQKPAANCSESSQRTLQSDQVHLSGRAKELADLRQVIKQMPEIRTDKVKRLKKSIREGTYRVDSFQLAGKILEEI